MLHDIPLSIMSNATTFSAPIEIIGVNPFVFLPDAILQMLFKAAGKAKSPIPVKGFINDKSFTQNLMYYKGPGDYTSTHPC